MAWGLIAEHVGTNRNGQNTCGLQIKIKDGQSGMVKPIGAVATERTVSQNPDVSFEDMVDKMVATGRKMIHTIEDLDNEFGSELQ